LRTINNWSTLKNIAAVAEGFVPGGKQMAKEIDFDFDFDDLETEADQRSEHQRDASWSQLYAPKRSTNILESEIIRRIIDETYEKMITR